MVKCLEDEGHEEEDDGLGEKYNTHCALPLIKSSGTGESGYADQGFDG